MPEIPDHLKPGLKLLFVGYNPSLYSARTGHHYANPNNRFWKVLHEAGLTPRRFRPEEDAQLLQFGYGFTNIVARPTQTAAERYCPKVVCYVGKGVYEQLTKRKKIAWGMQDESVVPGVTDFVAPSTSGLVRMPIQEIVSIYAQLKRWVRPEEII